MLNLFINKVIYYKIIITALWVKFIIVLFKNKTIYNYYLDYASMFCQINVKIIKKIKIAFI